LAKALQFVVVFTKIRLFQRKGPSTVINSLFLTKSQRVKRKKTEQLMSVDFKKLTMGALGFMKKIGTWSARVCFEDKVVSVIPNVEIEKMLQSFLFKRTMSGQRLFEKEESEGIL